MNTYNNSNNQRGRVSPLVLFQYFLLIAGVLTGIFWLVPYLKRLKQNQETKNVVSDIQNDLQVSNVKAIVQTPEVIEKATQKLRNKYKLIDKNRMTQILAGAKVISLKLGTAPSQTGYLGFIIPFPKMPWEDETAVVKELKKFPGVFPVLAEVYQTIYTKNRVLVDDLLKYVSDKDLDIVRDHYRKISKSYKYF